METKGKDARSRACLVGEDGYGMMKAATDADESQVYLSRTRLPTPNGEPANRHIDPLMAFIDGMINLNMFGTGEKATRKINKFKFKSTLYREVKELFSLTLATT